MKVFKNGAVNGYDGKPIMLPIKDEEDSPLEVKEAKLIHILWFILNSAPLETQQDSIQGMGLAKSLDAAKGKATIEIEEGVHTWLKPVAEKVTPRLFRINGSLVYEHIKEGFEKPHQPEKKDNGNKK